MTQPICLVFECIYILDYEVVKYPCKLTLNGIQNFDFEDKTSDIYSTTVMVLRNWVCMFILYSSLSLPPLSSSLSLSFYICLIPSMLLLWSTPLS